jgi:hypothetical protein
MSSQQVLQVTTIWFCTMRSRQGCQMFYFQTKNNNLGKFFRALDWKILIYFMPIWNIFRAFGKYYGRLVQIMLIWYIFQVLVSNTKKNLATLVHMRRSVCQKYWTIAS